MFLRPCNELTLDVNLPEKSSLSSPLLTHFLIFWWAQGGGEKERNPQLFHLHQIIRLNSFLAAKTFVLEQEKGQCSGRNQQVRSEPAHSS